MSRTKYILSLIATLFSTAIMCAATASPTFDYESNWNEVNKLMQKPRLKNARKKVQEIRTYATKADDEINILKCEVYDYAIDLGCEYNISGKLRKYDYASILNIEEGETIVVNHYKKTAELMARFKSPATKSCCELFMANILNDYITELYKEWKAWREESKSKYDIEDLAIMPVDTISKIIRNHTYNILKNKEVLLSTPSERYHSLFPETMTDKYKETHPTLYDFMLHPLLSFERKRAKIDIDSKQAYLPIQLVSKNLLENDSLNATLAEIITHHFNKGEYTAALTTEFLRLELMDEHNDYKNYNHCNTHLDYFNSIIDLYDGKTPLVVDAVVKRHNIMCLKIDRPDSNELKKIESFPKQIVEETEKYKKLYPNHQNITAFDKNIAWLKKSKIKGECERGCFGKGKDVNIKLQYANTETLCVDIYRSDLSPLEEKNTSFATELKKAKFVATKELELAPSNYRIDSDTIISIGNDFDYGRYIVFFHDKREKLEKWQKHYDSHLIFNVSDLSLLDVISTDRERSIFVVDGVTGHPVGNATVMRYDDKKRILKETQTSTSEGKATFDLYNHEDKYDRLHVIYAKKGKDLFSPTKYVRKEEESSETTRTKLNLLTDRHIYRPGQTIEGKAILTFLSLEEERVMENKEINIILKDANNEDIDSIIAVTNEFGSAPFRFAIPTDRLNGTFTIEATYKDRLHSETERHRISVESYKRPTAEVIVDVKDGSPLLRNSILEFVGKIKTFSGEPVEDAVVKYRISTYDKDNPLCHGETVCDAEGKYSFSTDKKIDVSYYWLDVYVDAVLPSGETVSGHKKIEIGTDSIYARIKLANNSFENKSSLRLNVVLRNNAQANHDAGAVITVATKEDKSKNIGSKTLITKQIKGNGEFTETIDLSSLRPAIYEVRLMSLDGDEINKIDKLIVYDKASTELPEGMTEPIWISCGKGAKLECSPSKDAEIIIGSAVPDAKILNIVRNENGIIMHDEWIDISNEQQTYKVSFDEYFANSKINHISVEFLIMSGFKLSSTCMIVKRKKEMVNHEIEVMEIVRNIVPGEKQKVKMKVKPATSKFEIAAVMVDNSLQDLPPRWQNLYGIQKLIRYPKTSMPYTQTYKFNTGKGYNTPNLKPQKTKFLWNNILSPDNYLEEDETRVVVGYAVRQESPLGKLKAKAKSKIRGLTDNDEDEIFCHISSSTDDRAISVKESGVQASEQEDESISEQYESVRVRENFAETAFFYPQLTTDTEGNVEFEYTVPDALTSWKMMFLAHDKQANSVISSENLQTKMPFAIKATLPRFVRKGDRCSFATTITNNAAEPSPSDTNSPKPSQIKGDVAIIVKDIATDKVIMQQRRGFKVEANRTKVEEWSFDIPAGVAAIEVKMVGKSGTFSDGEVHQLAVLPDGAHVVKSKPLHIRGGEEKTVAIDYDKKEMRDAELTVEYTDNAVWTALMALPSVRNARCECATELISTVYANQLAQHIATLYPEVKTVVEEWKKEGGNHAESPLTQNQELKNILLRQTPWVCEANNDTARRASIVDLYDADKVAVINDNAISKLQSLQQPDGGFSWLPDCSSNEYVTMHVVDFMVKMREHGALPPKCEGMLKNAVKYLDKALQKAYKAEKEKTGTADREWVFDLFQSRISYDKHLSSATKEILDLYIDKARKEFSEMTLYGKASFAIILDLKGEKAEAKKIVETLRQSATDSEDFGMYWKSNQERWGRYGSAILTHATLTKAFQRTGCDAKELADLRYHLLTKKETTQWKDPYSTLAAIDAIVGDGKTKTDFTADGNRTVAQIEIGGKEIGQKRTEGDGYVKIHYSKDDFTPDLCRGITIKQPTGQEGYGGIYIAYDAPYSKITSGNSGIEVKKEMYKVVVKSAEGDKETLEKIKSGDKLKKGDKVRIVMTIMSDRDIDFVQVTDHRAACLEPVRKKPGTVWGDGGAYYQSITDTDYNIFLSHIRKGIRVLDYTLHVTQSGEYAQGITKVTPLYCPAFSANSTGGKVVVE